MQQFYLRIPLFDYKDHKRINLVHHTNYEQTTVLKKIYQLLNAERLSSNYIKDLVKEYISLASKKHHEHAKNASKT